MSASIAHSASTMASRGASGDGFTMTVHPASTAGTIFIRALHSGPFHGTIATTTPTGSETTSARPPRPVVSSQNG